MSCVTIVVPPPLRGLVGGQSLTTVEAMTLRGVLEVFASRTGNAGPRLLTPDGRLQRFVRVFINGQAAETPSKLDAPVADGARVTILLALAGG